ncbi:MarR family transcriptional regulator [Seleniivibrio sp.]|uniref:MarR family winged helix-turn-helix transcriptional regulator n=1 Tax=Seleniivibrio sp. TaxID=2898801 RepID=UPI0025EF724D|nr:MarR family transcriptional regulator [Seleniivibrio sp.]MCD8552421.1 MarR family transcriptional regulator [Seleniivibrio sp.]
MNNNSAKILSAFIRLSRLVHRESHKHAHDMHDRRMHHGQWHLLSLIAENSGAKQSELSEILDMRPSSMTEMLVKLEQSGLIERRQDEKDQRVMRVYLSEKGEKALKASKAAIVEMSDALFGSLTEEEQTQFLALMEKLTANLEDKGGNLNLDDHIGHHHGGRCGRANHDMHHAGENDGGFFSRKCRRERE